MTGLFSIIDTGSYGTCLFVEPILRCFQASRILAQLLVAGGTMLARAAIQAYRQAVISTSFVGKILGDGVLRRTKIGRHGRDIQKCDWKADDDGRSSQNSGN